MGRSTSHEFAGTGRFQIRRKLGQGGMGVVYEAFDNERGQTVALKTLKRFDAQALFRFKNEFRALHDMQHPNLISLFELSEQDGDCFFTMELLRGVDFLSYVRGAASRTLDTATDETLSEAYVTPSHDTLRAETLNLRTPSSESRRYDEARLRASLAQLARGVAALHAAGMVHRDIKPSNIMVTDEGRVVLLDFGLVMSAAREDQSTDGSLVGTAEYMAPEQAVSGEVDGAADWYSVGVVLYEALTERLPHRGKSPLETLMNKQQIPAAPPRQWRADVPRDLDALCELLLSRDPKERPSAAIIFGQLGIREDDSLPRMPSSTGSRFSQSSPFVGRETELDSLRAAFDDSRSQPVVAFVEGESGLGKSELVRQFSRRLANDVPEAVILAGRCYERESVAYKAFDGIVDELSRYMIRLSKVDAAALLPLRAGLLPQLFPVLQRVEAIAAAPIAAKIPDRQERRRQMFGALRELFTRLAMRCPVVLIIDDLQWTDVDSLALLQEVLNDSAAPNLLLIATVRPMEHARRRRVLAALRTLDRRQIDLRAFSLERAEELAAILVPSADHHTHEVIAKEAAGHPLFVMELARYAQAQGQSRSRAEGVTLDETLWQRIAELPAGLLALLEMICIAGVPITYETAGNAADMRHSEVSKAAAGLRIAYLVRTGGVRKYDLIEPYHDRIREIVTRHLSSEERIRCHRRLALALEQGGAAKTAPQALVRHAEAAGDLQRAARHAEAAAAHAIEATAFDQAAEFFQTALDLGTHDEAKVRALRISLAEAYVNAGRGPEAAESFIAAAEGADPATRLDCQRQASEQWLISGHTQRGLSAMAELLAQIGVKMPATAPRALLSLLWIRARLRVGGMRWKRREQSDITRGVLTRLDIFKAASQGLTMVDVIRGADFHARGLLFSLRTGERSRVARALFAEALFFASQGSPRNAARARSLTERAAAIDEADPYLKAWKSMADGALYYFSSRFAPAAEHFADTESGWRAQAGATWELSSVRLFRLWSIQRMGLMSELGTLVDEYVRDATRRGDLYTQTTLIRSCHVLWLAKDDLDEARRVLEEAAWAPPEGSYHLQHWFAFRAEREMDLYEGTNTDLFTASQAEFRSLKKSMLLRVITIRIDAYWLRGRVALVSGPAFASVAKRTQEVRRMARLLERENDPFATSSAYLLRAASAVQEGDVAGALAILSIAIDQADTAELLFHAAAARRRQGELIGGDEGARLVADVDAGMASEGIENPARMTEVYAPGFTLPPSRRLS